jgi:ParB-like chromosome segregation protein Spo0J
VRELCAREAEWPADQVERWPIDRLIPYAKNSRSHSEAQIAQLAASMKEWGWMNPVLADEAVGVIAGHARILAARQLGYAEVPVMVAHGWTDAQKRALCDRRQSAGAERGLGPRAPLRSSSAN